MRALFRASGPVPIAVALAGRAICQTHESPDPRECARGAERLRAASLAEKAGGSQLAAVGHVPSLATEIAAELDTLHAELGRWIPKRSRVGTQCSMP
jgi:hypothetical protein